MKWARLLNDIREKVGLTQSPPAAASSSSAAPSALQTDLIVTPIRYDYAASAASPTRDKHELELDFKRFWEDFRSSSSEKEKEASLNFTVDAFCRLVKQQTNVAQLVTMLVETHIFSFVVGRAFVTDIEKLKISSKTRSLDVVQVLKFFSEATQDGLSPGSNLLTAVEVLVSGPIDKQSLLDSGIFCCLIHIFNSLLSPYESPEWQKPNSESGLSTPGKDHEKDFTIVRRLEVEGSVVHIMKALASHPSAALSLIEDDSLQLLFQMVANGSNAVFYKSKDGVVPLHRLQLHRHAMQILGLLLGNDSGSTAKYIHNYHLIKVLLAAVKDFNPDCGDSAYTMGIVDLLLECVELSYRPDSGGVSLRDDIRNAHGYPFLAQFALILSSLQKSKGIPLANVKSCGNRDTSPDGPGEGRPGISQTEDSPVQHLSPALSRLLDVLVNLAQTGPDESMTLFGSKGANSYHSKGTGQSRSYTSFDRVVDEVWEQGSNKVKDLEAIQVLLEIFLKADNRELQAEVLNRMFKIFSSHIENYELCQQLRTVPLFIQNMAGFPPSFQETILKILEYAVTVVNCVPEQELLSLSCLLQQSITSDLKQTILSFFVKLLSFDQQYKKVLREVGVLEVLLDELKQHSFLLGSEQQIPNIEQVEKKASSSSFKKHLDSKDVIISSPRLMESGSGRFPIFEVEATINLAWDCLFSLLKKAEANQAAFRSADGVPTILPFLASTTHRQGALRILSCLMIEDVAQAHADELSAIIEILKSGMVASVSGSPFNLRSDAKCDTMGTLWRILGSNNAAQRVFGEATGFSLLLTVLHDFQSEEGDTDLSSIGTSVKVFTYLLRLVTAAVCDNAVNRTKLHTIISSLTFFDLLSESGLLCVDCEKQVIQLLLEVGLEILVPPLFQTENAGSSQVIKTEEANFLLVLPSGSSDLAKKRVYNAGPICILIRSLLLFTPKVQLEVLNLIEKLARAGSFNQESLTSVGCVELLLETIHPFILGSSPLLSYALKIVEVLGAYRLSASELRMLIRYIFQMRRTSSGNTLVDMMERLILMEDMSSENISLAPFVEMDMSKFGHASVQVSLGERSWPPAAGYSFVCWFQFQNFLKSPSKESEPSKAGTNKVRAHNALQQNEQQVFRIFSVGAANSESTFYAELYLQEDGVLTLSTSNSSTLSFSGLELEEGRWHHLAVVHSKPNALAGLFQASFACVYLNGKLRHTGKLGYSPSPAGRSLQVTIGTPASHSKVCDLNWKLRSCYLFEEVLTPGCVCFMYILGRGYRGVFQDTDLLRFVPDQACGGGTMAILDSLETETPLVSGTQKIDSTGKQGESKADRSGIVWDLDRLGNISLQLSGKKLIFAFDGTSVEATRTSGSWSMLNLVDPMSAGASPIGGIPRFGRLHGDIYICRQCVIGDTVRPVGGVAVILALIEASETCDMLHMAIRLLASALHQNPQNLSDMQTCRGYHLLALFIRRRMPLFEMASLEMFFQIAACEASFSEPKKLEHTRTSSSPGALTGEAHFEDLNLSKFRDEISSFGSQADMDDFSAQKDTLSHLSELENTDIQAETSNCIVLSNADMVEHVLLDWTLWVTAPVSHQIALLVFLEHLVSMHWYRNHNLTILRRMNLVQHLLVTLQRGDVEVPVLEKLVVLLGVILEDGFLSSELEHVVTFVIMTFDPPELTPRHHVVRESMGKHVIVRNMLLEMLIDLQVTIASEELLEQWHKIVSSKLITYFLDEAVHPTSMRWIMTLLGVCLASSHTFALKFRTSGGYQGLARVLQSFYDSPDIYYILFCLIFAKPVYPRLPEVRMLDFHALIPSDGSGVELKFVELLDSALAMAKAAFDRLSMQSMLAYQTGNLSQIGGLVAELFEGHADTGGDLQGEALMHKTYAARLMGGEAGAPVAATSVLRFMVDLVKMCPPFSAVCRRPEFLESCVELYFSCVRAACAVKLTRELSFKPEEKNLNDNDDANSSPNSFSSLPLEQEESQKTSISVGSYPPVQISSSSEDPVSANYINVDNDEMKLSNQRQDSNKFRHDDDPAAGCNDVGIADPATPTSSATGSNLNTIYHIQTSENQNPASQITLDSPSLSDNSTFRIQLTPSSSPVIALTSSWLGSSNDPVGPSIDTPSLDSAFSAFEFDPSLDKVTPKGSTPASIMLSVSSKVLLEIDDSGYGGGPCSAGAAAILDFMAEVLADILTEQIKSAHTMESIVENVPVYVDSESVLVFQGLFLSRLMIYLERRLLRDDEEDDKKLDKSRWSSNLDALCWMIVDRVYMGAFPQPAGVLRTLEFLLSMLQLANTDGRIEEAAPAGKGLLSIGRGNKQLEAYIYAIFKNANRMIMYCFLPSFLASLGEDDLLSRLGLLIEPKKRVFSSSLSQEDSGINICTVLQLLVAHRQIIFCPSNVDTDLNCCLCVNIISLLRDQRPNVQNMAVDVTKYLLVHRRAALEDMLVSKPNQGQHIDTLRGGFDKLLTENSSTFFDWLQGSEQLVSKVLEQCAAIMWMQFITGATKFPGVRIKGMDGRRRKEMSRRSREAAKLDLRHWEQINERRYALELVRDTVSTELRVVRQDKYGWILHAESEWQTHLQQLVHERGILPMHKPFDAADPEWQLCPIEGPYRMRKKLERSKLKIESIQNVLDSQADLGEAEMFRSKGDGPSVSDSDSEPFFQLLVDAEKQTDLQGDLYDESSLIKETDDTKEVSSARDLWNVDQDSSVNEGSLHSALEVGVKSSSESVPITYSNQGRSEVGSLVQSSSKVDEVRVTDDTKSEKELHDNGEYLIRPYLEPLEKIRFRFNCERVVGLDKHDGLFLIGELCLYVIENFYIDDTGCICEKESEDELSVIDQALGVKKDLDFPTKSISSWSTGVKSLVGGRAWAYNGGAWGKEKACSSGNLPHLWRMWKLNSVHEILKRDYQLRPVAIEIFSMDGCNDLLVFHKKEREEVFKNLVAMNLPRNSMLDTTISGSLKQDTNEGGRLFKSTAKSFSNRWQNGEISNFQYLMHLNTLAGRGYSDLTQYPVFPWVLADYDSEHLDLSDPRTFRKLDRPMGCQTPEGEEEFIKRYESWDDPEVPKFHYGSHYSSAGIVLFYLLRLPPFSAENQKLQGGQFDHADRLFNSIKETWSSAAGKGNTSDVKELIPEFFYVPEFLENRFNLDLGVKQSGEQVTDVLLPPWAKGSVREFIRKHREALESDYVSENLHHWIDLIFGYKQRGKAAEEAVNVFYHYTYEGSVDIDSVTDPAMKASILAQINHFGQTPKQLFQKPHAKRRTDKKLPSHPLKNSALLLPREVRKTTSPITQIVTLNDKVLLAGAKMLLKPKTYTKYLTWGFSDRSLRFMSYDQDRLLSTHENLHGGNQIQCVGATHDGQTLVTGADDGLVCIWRIAKDGPRRRLQLAKSLCAHTHKVTCLHVSQPYMLIVTGSDDCTVLLWDLSTMAFVKQLPVFPSPVSAIYVNDLTGEIVTAAGVLLAVWSINGDCLAAINASQLPSDFILSITSCTFSDWNETNWYVTGHQSGAVKVWQMIHVTDPEMEASKSDGASGFNPESHKAPPEYRLLLRRILKFHKSSVTALHLSSDLKHLLSGDSAGNLVSWIIQDENVRGSFNWG